MTWFDLSFENGTQARYDNETNRLTDMDGNDLLDKNPSPPDFKVAPIVSPDAPVKKSKAPRTLKISMGLKCNYSCSYCNQAIHVGDSSHTNIDDVSDFMNRLDDWLEGEPEQVEIWGGEPWLYWKKIQVLLPELRKRFPKTEFLTITNGSLFNQTIYDLIVEYDITVVISHDAMGQHLRGPDPLLDDEKREWIDKVVANRAPSGKFCFNSVMCAGNHNPQAIKDYFYREFGPEVRSDFEGIVNDYSDGEIGLVREFTVSEYLQLQDYILQGFYDGSLRDVSYFGGRYNNFIEDLYNRKPSYSVGQKCGMDRPEELAVDLQGNAMTCQNTGANGSHYIGNVYEDNVELDTSWHWSHRKECASCPVLHLCKGSCMYLEGDNWSRSCNNEYYTAMPIFIAAMSDLAGSRLLTIEGQVIRPDYQIPTG